MIRTPKRLVNGSQLTTAAVTYYTAPKYTTTTISALSLTNTSGAAVTVTLYLVPYLGTASAANCILSARALAAGETYNAAPAIGQSLAPEGFLQALASANTSITIVASGYETT